MMNSNSELENVNFINLRPFYVYELRHSETSVPFYIGKGKNNRIDMHEVEAEKIKQNTATPVSDLGDQGESEEAPSEKVAMINEIKKNGFTVVTIIVGRFETENEALMVESVLIKWVYGLENLTNVVHGHNHKLIRPFEEKETKKFSEIEGIDRPRRIVGIRDGNYTSILREKISKNSIYEKLEVLRDELQSWAVSLKCSVSDPDLSMPQDPCIIVSGFDDVIQLQVKIQLTGKEVVFNLIPVDRAHAEEFKRVLTGIDESYVVKKGNRFIYYTQSHDVSSQAGGSVKGVAYEDFVQILRMISETVIKISNRKSRIEVDNKF